MARRDGPNDHSVNLTVTAASAPIAVRRTAEIRTGDDHRWPNRVRSPTPRCNVCASLYDSPLGATDTSEATLEKALNSESHSIYHPVGSCRMGSDPDSVVTPELNVRGVQGLRVADASVMPTIIRGHTNAPSILIGAKAADLIIAANHR